jgi:PAS domain S-box-containing protein
MPIEAVIDQRMRVAIVLIPEPEGESAAARELASVAASAGWTLQIVDGPSEAIARLASSAPAAGNGHDDRELLRVTLSSIGDAVVTTDTSGRIVFMNGVAEALTGWTLAEARGEPIATVVRVVDGESGEPGPSAAERVAEHGAIVGVGDSTMLVGRDGALTPIEECAAPIRDDAGATRGTVIVLRDVTERKRAESERARFVEEIASQRARLELLNEVGRALSAELDLRTLAQRVTDTATRLCGAAYGAFVIDAPEGDSGGATLFALSGASRETFARVFDPRTPDLFGASFRTDAPMRLDDATRDTRYARSSPFARVPHGALPVRSYLAVPVVSRSGRVLGGLFFGHPDAGVFTDLDEQIVARLAAQAAIAVDNARLYRAAQQEIDERRRAQEEMMRARDEAEAANRAKDQFLAVLSHELRTPLTPVLAVTQVLENDERIADDQRPLVEMIRRNIELEARLIDDLLDLTRIAKGKLSLTFETVDVHRLVNAVVGICRGDIANKGLELVVDLQARDHFIRADSARIHQVLWNLLKNAVKFTPEGRRITVRTINDRPGHLRIEVVDTGIGIPPTLLPRIFNVFEQGSVDMRQYGGLGLGLSISRSLVEMHGGTLSAASEGANRGSTFTVEIDTVVRLRVEGGVALGEGPRRAVRVLIVDDHIETSKVMKLLLERRGYVVCAAHTVHDALEATRTADFDLLISDIGLPDGSGLDLMRSLHDRPLRGIALSGFGMDEDIARSREAGFAEHLIKPVSFQTLQEAIGRVLGS